MDSKCVRLESNTVTAEEEVVKNSRWWRSYEESVRSLLGGYKSVAELKWHMAAASPSATEDDDDGESSLYVSFCSNMMTHDLPLQNWHLQLQYK
jgi:hypothetical protein